MRNNKYTFWRLLSEKRIVIPIIQRDYAQGREGKEYVRKNFLEQLGKAVFNEEKTELDFVYGTESKVKDTIEMFPLDGQQRLTTLWLLHWYVAYKAKELSKVKHILQNFSYETRTSSREFCKKLCELEYYESDNIVGLIKQQTWFFSAWQQDPTIKAMLVMLSGTNNAEINKGEDFVDGIEELFDSNENVDFKNCWYRLTGDNCPIQFNFLPLQSNELPISDDLYIKMNARGKALTSFENFKADLVDWVYKDKYNEFWGENDQEKDKIKNRAEFVSAIDNKWTDIFWNKGKAIGRVDEIYFVFLNRFFYNLVITDKKNPITDKNAPENKYYAYFNNIEEKMLFEDFGLYEYFLSQGEKVIGELANVLKNYSESKTKYSGEETFENILKCNWNYDFCFIPEYKFEDRKPVKTKDYAGNDIMKFTNINQMERVVFYAICKYFNEGPIDSDDAISLKRWMRFVWNLVSEFDGERPIIRNINAMQEAIFYIDKISSHDVYIELEKQYETLLPNGKIDHKTSLGRRFQEEIVKARKILEASDVRNDDINEDKIISAEKYTFFRGAIRFLFTDGNGNPNWNDFDKKFANVQKLFDENGLKKDSWPLSNQVLLSFCTDWDNHLKRNKLFGVDKNNWLSLLLNNSLTAPVNQFLLNPTAIQSQGYHKVLKLLVENKDLWSKLITHNKEDYMLEYKYGYPCIWIPYNLSKTLMLERKEREGFIDEIVSKGLGQRPCEDDSIFLSINNENYYFCKSISFIYKNYKFVWQDSNWVDMYKGDIKLWDCRSEICDYEQLHTQLNGDGNYRFKDVSSLLEELNRCITKYEEMAEQQLPNNL